ncbi:MAG: DUF47 family protein [Candidatus Thermoplasmatota archaeon]|jgi:uncharacterized protein Yka (UPF0111/DUF47 family)|nr:DUF47 family protein [Candidatus Sysuiplasma jiujiangense]MCL4316861.1 DUF47 family protein [Candidatus Thermoplasmatota archaeon]MCL5252580.1 DUF47 family protein [Candidatus Thermoplasmatota archaeon]
MNLRDLKGMLIIGERKVFGEVAEIIDTAREADSIITAMFVNPRGDSIQQENEKIRLLEKKSDNLSFRIKNEITNGAISSNIIDNLLECVEMADSVMDDFYYISREMNRMRTVDTQKEDGKLSVFNEMALSMMKLADQAMELLTRMLKSKDIGEMKEDRKSIEKLEEDGDNIKDAAFDKLYGIAAEINFLQFNHVSNMIHKIDDILDGCEDVSDLVLAIATSISK